MVSGRLVPGEKNPEAQLSALCYRPDCQPHVAKWEVVMRRLRNFLLLLPILLAMQGLAFAQSSDEKRLSITKDVMEDFAHGSVASVRERFSADLRDAVSESDLKTAREDLA